MIGPGTLRRKALHRFLNPTEAEIEALEERVVALARAKAPWRELRRTLQRLQAVTERRPERLDRLPTINRLLEIAQEHESAERRGARERS